MNVSECTQAKVQPERPTGSTGKRTRKGLRSMGGKQEHATACIYTRLSALAIGQAPQRHSSTICQRPVDLFLSCSKASGAPTPSQLCSFSSDDLEYPPLQIHLDKVSSCPMTWIADLKVEKMNGHVDTPHRGAGGRPEESIDSPRTRCFGPRGVMIGILRSDDDGSGATHVRDVVLPSSVRSEALHFRDADSVWNCQGHCSNPSRKRHLIFLEA